MNKEEVKIKDEFIRLGQAMKLSGAAERGIDAKFIIQDGDVKVNGETETRRGRKLYNGDIFSYEGRDYEILSPEKNKL